MQTDLYVPTGYVTETFQPDPPEDISMFAQAITLILPAWMQRDLWCCRTVVEPNGIQHVIIHPDECHHEEFDDAEEE